MSELLDVSYIYDIGDCWISEDETVEIREGSIVRLRVIGVSPVDAGVISATGTIKDSFLGQIEVN